MTGFGSPCGACKFLRRKCVKGCIFAPYFSHEQGASHFSAIHKVFGASNVSKLLMHLPAGDRSEAAVTISYEAQARIQDPIYGCVAHIFALQQQVVTLQAQLDSLKAQVPQAFANASTSTTCNPQEEKLNTYGQGFFQMGDVSTTQPPVPNTSMNADAMMYYNNGLMGSNCIPSYQDYSSTHLNESSDNVSFSTGDDSSCSIRPPYHDMEDLRSVAYAYLHRT